MKFVASLRDFGRDDLSSAGGKGANLGELVRAGLPVPEGFVITTAAYGAAVQPLDLRIADRLAAYADLGAGPVAVRSSATAEDLPGAAFAGQQDTYLNVIGEMELSDAVRRCWASLWTERAISYRARLGIDSAEIRIAVVVQRMINADMAGVMFTADPISGDRDTIMIDASIGLGEAVVSGLVTPDHYVLDDQGRIREFHPGDPDRTQRLPDRVLAELARLGHAVARHLGVRGRPGVAAASASHDRAPAATDRTERCAAEAWFGTARLPSRAPLPHRHDYLGAVRAGRHDGGGHREIWDPRRVRGLPPGG